MLAPLLEEAPQERCPADGARGLTTGKAARASPAPSPASSPSGSPRPSRSARPRTTAATTRPATRATCAAAEEIVTAAGAREGCADIADLLAAALDKAAPLGSTEGAWTLRHAFDTILEEVAATA